MMTDIKMINEPSVYVLGRQVVDNKELDRFLEDHGVTWETDSSVGAEVLCETAGRVCYMSFSKPRPGGNEVYLQHIKEVGHGSVLEHACWNLLFTGVSRSLTHELVRHRAGMGYSQLSQRYVDESVAEYVVPPELQEEMEIYLAVKSFEPEYFDHARAHAQATNDRWEKMTIDEFIEAHAIGKLWANTVFNSHLSYVQLSDRLMKKVSKRKYQEVFGQAARDDDPVAAWVGTLPAEERTAIRKTARQAARSVLPNATETKIFVTANARALRHFLEMRGSRHADPEIRKLANKVFDVLKQESHIFGDYVKVPLPDGTFELRTEYRKV